MVKQTLVALCVLALACGDDSTGTPDTGPGPGTDADVEVDAGEVDIRLATVRSLGQDVILPTLQEFVTAATALESATAAWAADPTSETRAAAQEGWQDAMDVWQQLEVMQVGPAGRMDITTAGEDLRDEIYSWPEGNPCVVDQEIVSQEYANVDAFTASRVNARGLDALEYLIFYDGADNACASRSQINRDGLWAEVSDLDARRAAYSATAATLVRRAAEDLVGRWESAFLNQLMTAGQGSDVFSATQDALNAISDAMFYLDKESKDMKLAEPAGISDLCSSEACPELRESLWANYSISNLRNNVIGFRRLFDGPEGGTGFRALLEDVGAGDLATRFGDAIAAAEAALEAVSNIPDALDGTPDGLQGQFDALKAVTDILKSEFITVLDLQLPRRAETDND
ncbi:MAG: imelysin family protein [Myxococcota bacterium]